MVFSAFHSFSQEKNTLLQNTDGLQHSHIDKYWNVLECTTTAINKKAFSQKTAVKKVGAARKVINSDCTPDANIYLKCVYFYSIIKPDKE